MAGKFQKWLPATPRERPGEVASRALRSRLDAVRRSLRRAAKDSHPSSKHVHELRACARRAEAALALFDEFVPRRRAAWFEKQLDKLRHATSDVRDLDVFGQRLAEMTEDAPLRKTFETSLGDERKKAERPIKARYRRLCRGGRFKQKVEKLLERVKAKSEYREEWSRRRFGSWARHRLASVVEEFFKAEPEVGAEPKEWHKFRIRGKELRHVMETTAGVFERQFRDELYPIVEQLLDHLGQMNDLAMAQERVKEMIEEDGQASQEQAGKRLVQEQELRFDEAHEQFLDWWRCGPRNTLLLGLAEYAAGEHVPA